jgi:hypothetical protein
LINLKLRHLPLYTQPLLREGLAVYWGGRWGKAPSTLLDLGGFLYREQIVDLDSLLTMRDFQRSSSADIAYPVAGLFAGYLYENLGDDIWKLYRTLSGSFRLVHGMPRANFKDTVTQYMGVRNWPTLMEGFEQYIARVQDERVDLRPGRVKSSDTLRSEQDYAIVDDGDWLGFEFSRAPGEKVEGNLLFGLEPQLVGSGSELYGSQYGEETPFEGYRFGIRYDQNEVGLYDYATDNLLAKYIWGLNPSDAYFDEDHNCIHLKLRANLVDLNQLKADNVRLLDH